MLLFVSFELINAAIQHLHTHQIQLANIILVYSIIFPSIY